MRNTILESTYAFRTNRARSPLEPSQATGRSHASAPRQFGYVRRHEGDHRGARRSRHARARTSKGSVRCHRSVRGAGVRFDDDHDDERPMCAASRHVLRAVHGALWELRRGQRADRHDRSATHGPNTTVHGVDRLLPRQLRGHGGGCLSRSHARRDGPNHRQGTVEPGWIARVRRGADDDHRWLRRLDVQRHVRCDVLTALARARQTRSRSTPGSGRSAATSAPFPRARAPLPRTSRDRRIAAVASSRHADLTPHERRIPSHASAVRSFGRMFEGCA